MDHFEQAVEFGRKLIYSKDLDPVYSAFTVVPKRQRARLLFAYSCLYHLGASAYIAEGGVTGFCAMLDEAALNKDLKWPRGSERRHWRGKNAQNTMNYFYREFDGDPEAVTSYWAGDKGRTFQQVAVRVQEFPSFGPWIAFKVADMLDRCLELPVDFSDCELGIYKEPKAGAELIFPHLPLDTAVRLMLKELGRIKAPPLGDRWINVQEVETIFCKYKSHVNGHYEVGKDIKEVRHGLEVYPHCKLAKRMLKEVELLYV